MRFVAYRRCSHKYGVNIREFLVLRRFELRHITLACLVLPSDRKNIKYMPSQKALQLCANLRMQSDRDDDDKGSIGNVARVPLELLSF
jgi:hypothetical protein